MAAYKADIEIGVRGARALEQLRSDVNKTADAVDSLNSAVSGRGSLVQSIQNYTNSLNRAAESLRKVAAGTEVEAKAVREYVTALGQANSVQERQNKLIAQEIELRRKQKLAASGIAETAQAYTKPIGPARSPLQGQTSTVEERIRRTLQQRADENNLQQALLRLEQKTTAELNRQLEAQASIIRGKREVLDLVDKTARKSRLLAGGPAAGLQGPLAGPGAMGFPVALPMSKVEQQGIARAAEIRDRYQQLFLDRQARLLGLKNRENTLQIQLRRLDQQAVELTAAKINGQKQLNTAADNEVRIRKSLQNAGAIQGPALPPSLQGRGGLGFGSRAQGVALGAGFPLLFGGGPGAVLGGAAGGLVGGPGGFAAQIALSAIGQQFDKLGEQAIKVGRALNPLTFDLETFVGAAGIAGTATAEFLAKVEQYAGKTEAAKEATKLLAARIGTDATNALRKFGEDAQKLGNQLSIIFTTVLANIARIVGPLIAGLAGAAERAALVGGFKQRKGLTGREAVAQQILGTTGRGGRGKGGAGADIRALGQQVGLTGTTREITEGAKRIAATSQKAYQSAQESALSFKATQLEAAADGAKSAKKLRDELEKLGIKYEKLLTVSRKDLEIARESDPIKKLRLEQDKQIQQINNKYAEDLKKVTGTQAEQIVLELQANEIALVRLDIEQKISREYQKQAEEFVNLYTIFSKFQSDLGSSTFRGGPAGAGVGVDVGAAFGMTDGLTSSKTETAAQEAKKALEDLIEPANLVKQTATGIGGAFTDSFRNVIKGSMGAQEALANFFTRIADAFLDMAAQIITQLIVIKALESAIGLLGGGGDTSTFTGSGPVPFPSGLNIGVAGFKANGGPVGANKPYMVGERGPELFVPGRSGTIVPNNQLGAGGATSVVVNVDASGSKVEGNSQQAKQLGDSMAAAIQQELIKQKRPGGLLA